jgi:hypothetical protein
MWTVIGMKDSVEDPSKGEQEYTHAFMILSQQDSTMVSYASTQNFRLLVRLCRTLPEMLYVNLQTSL